MFTTLEMSATRTATTKERLSPSKRFLLKALLSACGAFFGLPSKASQLTRTSSVMGWDLTYQRLIRQLGIKPPNFLLVWAERIRDRFAPGLMLQLGDDPLISAFLVEHAIDGHAGDPTGVWAGRTSNQAFVQTFVLGRRSNPVGPPQTIDVATFENAAATLWQWKTTALPQPTRSIHPKDQEVLDYSYVGVVSAFQGGKSRQWPIALRDLFDFKRSSPQVDPVVGPLGKLLQTLLPPREQVQRDPQRDELERLRIREMQREEFAQAFYPQN